MDVTTIKCRELQVGDWITNESGLPTQIITVSGACAYAIFGGDEGDPWVFDDYIYLPTPIPLTPEILEKNGWKRVDEIFMEKRVDENTYFSWADRYGAVLSQNGHYMCDCKYVHELQHALHLCGLDELANNFKI